MFIMRVTLYILARYENFAFTTSTYFSRKLPEWKKMKRTCESKNDYSDHDN
jgi:hypothetical protein